MSIESQAVGHHGQGVPERPGIDGRHLLWLGAAALALLCFAIFGLGAIYWRAVPVKTMTPPHAFPQPRVEPHEAAELKRILNRQRQELAGYRWANRQHTLVQIPIERAMRLIVQRGARAYDPITSAPGALSSPEAGAERATTPSAARTNSQSGASASGARAENAP
jgi:hypothetical protein